MEKITETMFALLRFIFLGQDSFCKEEKILTEVEGKALYALSKKHDLSHIIAVALDSLEFTMTDNVKNAFHKQKMTAVYRYEMIEGELEKITALLEENGIKYMPLKGAVIKSLYPEKWMRTNSDIDILVNEEELINITQLFKEKLGYSAGEKGKHDIGFRSHDGVHVELHYRLLERNETADKILSAVWNNAKLTEGKKFCYEMTDEFFYFYHVAHMAKHFRYGGCGIRNFIDLWLLNNKKEYSEELRKEILERGRMTAFDETVKKITEAWFLGKDKDDFLRKIEKFIMNGGLYGNLEQHIAIRQAERSKIGYFVKRIFIKRETLAFFYPTIKKYPFLTPYFVVKRWCKLFDKKMREQVKNEIKINLAISEKRKDEIDNLLETLEI